MDQKQTADYSAEAKLKIPEFCEPARKDASKLPAALENLLTFEKKTRLAADARSTTEVAVATLNLCFDCKNYDSLNDMINTLFTRRAQLQKVLTAVMQEGIKFVDRMVEKKDKYTLINTLRQVSAGKIFVELERARLTKSLSDMKEQEGNVPEACDILQDIQVETIGTMEVREKSDLLLEQLRLCLAKQDAVRSEIISRKIQPRTLAKDEFQDLKVRYYTLMIQFHLNRSRYFDVCKAYQEIYNTKTIQADPSQWKPILAKLVLFCVLSPFDYEVSELLTRVKVDKKLMQLPAAKRLVDLYTTDELINWPLADQVEWKNDSTFTENKEQSEKRWSDFHKRIVQHNIRVLSKYYNRITTTRMAEFLQLDEAKAEEHLSELVSTKQLFAKVDRPAGIVVFARKQTATEQLDAWSGDITKMLSLIETTCHLINKETMMHKVTLKEEKSAN